METKPKRNSDFVRRQSNVSATDAEQEQQSPDLSPKMTQGKIGHFDQPTSFDDEFHLIISEFRNKKSSATFHRPRNSVKQTAEKEGVKEV